MADFATTRQRCALTGMAGLLTRERPTPAPTPTLELSRSPSFPPRWAKPRPGGLRPRFARHQPFSIERTVAEVLLFDGNVGLWALFAATRRCASRTAYA